MITQRKIATHLKGHSHLLFSASERSISSQVTKKQSEAEPSPPKTNTEEGRG